MILHSTAVYKKYVSLVLCFALLLLSGCKKENPEIMYVELEVSDPGDYVFNDQHYDLLECLYCENDKSAFFDASIYFSETAADFDLYRLSNYISLIYGIQQNTVCEETYERVCRFLSSTYLELIGDRLDFSEILNFVNITSNMKITKYDDGVLAYMESKCYPLLETVFDPTDETNSDLVAIVNLSLKIFEKIGHIPENIKYPLKKSLESLVMKSVYFTLDSENVALNIFDGGMVILESCILYNSISDSEAIDIGSASNWFETWCNLFCDSINRNEYNYMVSNTGLLKIDRIAKYFDYTIDISDYLAVLQLVDWGEFLAQDPKITYECLYLLKTYMQYIPNVDTIISNYELFTYNISPDIRIKEQYYGFELSKMLGLEINEELFYNTLSQKISEKSSIEELFYFLLLNQKIGRDREFRSQYETVYVKLLEDHKNELEQPTILNTTYYLLYIGIYFDIISFPDVNLIDRLKEHVLKSDLEQDTYWYSLICNSYAHEYDTAFICSKINSFQGDTGYMISTKNPELINVLSTYRMYVAAQCIGEDLDKSCLQPFLNNHRGVSGGYFLMANTGELTDYRDNFTMQAFYCGIALEAFIG